MLNIFKLNTKKPNINSEKLEKDKHYYKDFPVSTREWSNSIYAFNEKTLGLIPQASTSAIKLIRNYLCMYNSSLLRNIKKARLSRRFRRLSCHRVYVSNGEFKHTNDKVIITLYTYNRERFNYLYFFSKKYLNLDKKILEKIYKRFYLIKTRGFSYLKKANIDKYNLIKSLNKSRNIIINNKSKSFYNLYLINFYKKWVKKALHTIKIYLYYKQLLYINISKLNYTYLEILKNYIQKIYGKKVEFNIINLKYNYLNSDIFSESVTLKITRNRRKMLRYLKRLIIKTKVCRPIKYVLPDLNSDKLNIENMNDPIEVLLDNKTRPSNETSRKKVVLKEIKYKRLSGVRLEASGRLTKRNTASRSVRKLEYKGNLRNIYSTYMGLSTVILKGNIRSNLQYTKLKSKTRIGSFGIKGWVSGS